MRIVYTRMFYYTLQEQGSFKKQHNYKRIESSILKTMLASRTMHFEILLRKQSLTQLH